MSYLTLAVPIALIETAKRVSQAFDIDSGGYEAFQGRALDDKGNEWAVYGTPESDEWVVRNKALHASPVALAASVSADKRWPKVKLSPAEAGLFSAKVKTSEAYGMEVGLLEMGLILEAYNDGR